MAFAKSLRRIAWQRGGQLELGRGRAAIGQVPDDPIDLIESLSLIQEHEEAASELGLVGAPLDRLEVIVDRVLGFAGQIGEAPPEHQPAPPVAATAEDLFHPVAGRPPCCFRGRRVTPARLADQVGGFDVTPEGAPLPFDPLDLPDELLDRGAIAGRDGQVRTPPEDLRVLRLELRQFRQELAGPHGIAEAVEGRRQLIQERRSIGGRDSRAGSGEPIDGPPGLVPPSSGPESDAGPQECRARPQILLGLVQHAFGLPRVILSLEHRREGNPATDPSGVTPDRFLEDLPGGLGLTLQAEHVGPEHGQVLGGVGQRLLCLPEPLLDLLPSAPVSREPEHLLDRQPDDVEPQFGPAARHRHEDLQGLIKLARSLQRPGVGDAGGFQTRVGLGDVAEGFQFLLVGPRAGVAFGQHEVELAGEPVIELKDGPSLLDPPDRLEPLSPMEEDPCFEIGATGIAQAGTLQPGDVIAGLVLPVDLVLEDEIIGQFEGKGDGRLDLIRPPQDGLGPVEMALARLEAGQADGQLGMAGIELPARPPVEAPLRRVPGHLAGDGGREPHLGVLGRQLQGPPDVGGVPGWRELLRSTAIGRRRREPTTGSP